MAQNFRFQYWCTRRELRNIYDFGNEIIFDAISANYRKVSHWWVEEILFKFDNFFYFLTCFLGLHDAAAIAGIRNYKMKTWVCTRPATTDQTWGRIWACNLSDTKTEAIQIFTIYVIWPYVVIEKKIVSWTRWKLKTINLLWTYLQNCENSVVTWFFCKLCVLYWLLQLYIMFLPDVLWCYRPVLNKIKLMILTKFVFQ